MVSTSFISVLMVIYKDRFELKLCDLPSVDKKIRSILDSEFT